MKDFVIIMATITGCIALLFVGIDSYIAKQQGAYSAVCRDIGGVPAFNGREQECLR